MAKVTVNNSVDRLRLFKKFNYIGLVMGLVFFCLSLTPSLLPRPWLFQGIISGISVAVGYGIGVLISFLVRWLTQKDVSITIKKRAWVGLAILMPTLMLIYLVVAASWQNSVRELVGEEPVAGIHMLQIVVITLLVFFILFFIARCLRKLNLLLHRFAAKYVPDRIAIALSGILVVLLLVWLVNGVLFTIFVNVSNTIYSGSNKNTPYGISQPLSPYRSGSPESFVTWDSLGYQGKAFVGRGANQQQLQDFIGSQPKEQIRIYSGVDSAPDATTRADLVLKEIERTDAFSRKVLIVATATGTGWLEPQSVDSIEYMYGGDTAIVSQQYSYLPSWISFLVDKQNATDAGRTLFDAVYGEWVKLPINERPKLIVYGLSLGSFGGQSAFTGVNNVINATDGALFMGTPSDTELWRNITDNRDEGSPEWQPEYGNGKAVRFAATNEDITQKQSEWSYPRMLYIQHGSDPVVWFNFNLPLHQPDWLREKRAPDVSSLTRWMPFVTFFQITVDQFFGVNVPNGYGHNYSNTIVNSWYAVVPPTNWTDEQTNKLQAIIDTYSNE